MKQTTPSPCKKSGGSHTHQNSHLNAGVAEASQVTALFQPTFQDGASHLQPAAIEFNHPLQMDRALSMHNRIGSLDHSPSSYRRHLSGIVMDDNLQTPNSSGALSSITPESLLEIIISTQRKLQQLQAVVELVVRAGGQGQEHQSLTAGVKSIMSQLMAATACLQQQPPILASAFPLSGEAMDLRFDGFYDTGMNNAVSAGSQEAMGASMKLAGIRTSPLSSDSELQPEDRELVSIKRAGVNRQTDSRFKDHASNALFNDFTSNLPHGNTPGKLADFNTSSESLRIACNENQTNRSQEAEDHDFMNVSRDDDDDGESENLPPGSYEVVEMAAAEILAEHAHFCEICGKGFKRDANLRMHMRGHGDEYKTTAALARPEKLPGCLAVAKPRRYSCPFMGCKRNKQHKKFQPLKTTLCVKNHYKRSHCPKLLTCSKCKVKKFSVVADLKTHEKHCGQDKWQCSCGTTFSRKDKLIGHVSLFAGHAPLIASYETDNFKTHGEPSGYFFTNGSAEDIESLRGSKTTSSQFQANEQLAGIMFDGVNNTEASINDLINMDEGIFRGDGRAQQDSVRGERSCHVEKSQNGAAEVLAECNG